MAAFGLSLERTSSTCHMSILNKDGGTRSKSSFYSYTKEESEHVSAANLSNNSFNVSA